MYLSLPVFIYVCYLLIRLATKYMERKPAADTEVSE